MPPFKIRRRLFLSGATTSVLTACVEQTGNKVVRSNQLSEPPPKTQDVTPPEPSNIEINKNRIPPTPKQIIIFNGAIKEETVINLSFVITNVLSTNAHECYLIINSGGGDVVSGIGIYGILRSLPIKLITVNNGYVASMADALYLAGDERIATPQSKFMFHPIQAHVNTDFVYPGDNILGTIDEIIDQQNTIDDIYLTRSKFSKNKVEETHRREFILNASEALELGVATRVEDFQIPRLSRIQIIGNH